MAASQRNGRARTTHVPERTCIGCREAKPKRELIRIGRTESGGVAVDLTGKGSGRGAYLCKTKSCWQIGLRKERLGRALRADIAAEDRSELAQYGDTLPR